MMEKSFQSKSNNEYNDFNVLLVTANVGSLFEDPKNLLESWMFTLLEKVMQVNPKFFALHIQEVGGKTYEKSMDHVYEFIRELCVKLEKKQYGLGRIYMDENYHSAENFTALGNLYFLHVSLVDSKIWNFSTQSWEIVNDMKVYSGEMEEIPTKDKAKFPIEFFPECKWSRKGYMRTRWDINNTIFELANIHLFHDASNFIASMEFPSTYSKFRRRALIYTLNKFHRDERNGSVPLFIFGDFNFRCNTGGVIAKLTKDLTTHRVYTVKDNGMKVYYHNTTGENIFTLGKKEFQHKNHQITFRGGWLKKFDRDLEPLQDFLNEFSIKFAPTYPFEEKIEYPVNYMTTRCPSWCDRILMTHGVKQFIADQSPNVYNIIGENICMGDHKPVYLNIHLKGNQGISSWQSRGHTQKSFDAICNIVLQPEKYEYVKTETKDESPSIKIGYVIIQSINKIVNNLNICALENVKENEYDVLHTKEVQCNQAAKLFKETSF